MTQAYEGYWWPAGSDDQTAGRLDIGADRIELKLNGQFGPLTLETTEYPVIHGMSGTRRITLRQAWEASWSLGTGLPTQRFLIGSVWLGAHLEGFSITGFSLHIEHLAAWFALLPPRRTSPLQADGSVTAAHVAQDPLRADLPRATVTVQALHDSASGPGSLTLSSVAIFGVDFPQTRAYDDADRAIIRPFLNLIALATARAPAIVELTVTVPRGLITAETRDRSACDIEVVASWLVPPWSDRRDLSPDELIFHAHDLAPDFTRALGSWFRAHEDLGTACDLYIGNIVAPPRFMETKFIVHCQAVEALHAKRFPSLRVSREDHELRKKRVLDGLSPPDQAWVEPAIWHSNQKSLRDRLTDLIQGAPAAVQGVIGPVEVFADRVVRRRNDVAHGASLTGAVDELFVLNEKLRLLLHALLMSELGLSAEAVDKLIGHSRLLRSVRFVAANAEAAGAAQPATRTTDGGSN